MGGGAAGSRLPEAEPSSAGWVDLAVVPLVAVLAVPTLLWFGDHPWAVLGKDAPRYLFAASELVSGGGLDSLAGAANYNGGHGPVFPALLGSLMLLVGRDTEALIWAMRLTALLNRFWPTSWPKASRARPRACSPPPCSPSSASTSGPRSCST